MPSIPMIRLAINLKVQKVIVLTVVNLFVGNIVLSNFANLLRDFFRLKLYDCAIRATFIAVSELYAENLSKVAEKALNFILSRCSRQARCDYF